MDAEMKAYFDEILTAMHAGFSRMESRFDALEERLGSSEEPETRLDGRNAELVRSGLARSPRGRLDPRFLKLERPADATGRGLETVLEERAEGW